MRLTTALAAGALLAGSVSAQTVEGKFGRALPVEKTTAHAELNPVYTVIPITVECWVKLADATATHVLVANELKTSGTHWHLYAEKDTGHLCAHLPQWRPTDIKSTAKLTDDQWHHVALTFDGETATLFLDARPVATQKLTKAFRYPDSTPLTIGHLADTPGRSGALIDEVRISRIVRPITEVPTAPYKPDADTIALWHFDEEKAPFADASKTNNPIRLKEVDARTSMFAMNNRWMEMDFGPFFSATFNPAFPAKGNLTPKGVAVRVANGVSACFDTELLRPTLVWEGKFIEITPGREGLAEHPKIPGGGIYGTLPTPGWSTDATFTDPRPDKQGPLPRDAGRYKGLYVHGDRVVFSYNVYGTDMLESYHVDTRAGRSALFRTIEVGPHEGRLFVKTVDPANPPSARAVNFTATGGNWGGTDTHAILEPTAVVTTLRIAVTLEAKRPDDDRPHPHEVDENLPALSTLTKGGPPRYPTPIITRGTLGSGEGPFVVDNLNPPFDNPHKSFLRFAGHDFFRNGDLAVCSVSGDVWVVSNINDALDNLKWRRFATGLHQPLGLRIVDDKVYVLGRDQITRLHDLNNDGEADFYENFNNDCRVTTNGHAYATNLDTDPQGNFYYTKCGDGTPHGGTLLRVSADGSNLNVFATGLRNPNGMGVSPTGMVTEADNQGEWVPASRLDVVSQGEFLGYTPMSKQKTAPTHPGYPLCWMPQNVDNSSGGQCWVESDKWGLPRGTMLHTSYGSARLLGVFHETVAGKEQGGVWAFPFKFDSGAMRGRFSPTDGQLYVSGLRGWQTTGSKDGCLQRVRYTGKPLRMPIGLNVHQNGLKLSFTDPLDEKTAADPESYSILQWNYKWASSYGSRHWSVVDPKKQGYDTLTVKSARLLPDRKSVFLEVEDLQPVMQMKVEYQLKTADGADLKSEIHNTIHHLAPAFEDAK